MSENCGNNDNKCIIVLMITNNNNDNDNNDNITITNALLYLSLIHRNPIFTP